MKLSKNLGYYEGVRSFTAYREGIDNTPTEQHLLNMFILANNLFEQIREGMGDHPIYVSSFYRSYNLNKKIGGARGSDHLRGSAIDLDGDVYGNVDNGELFHFVKNNLDYKLLIWEFGNDRKPDWVHISYESGLNNEKRTLRAIVKNGEKKYIKWEQQS